ncbi:AraC family transcriptional regulator [Ammoniphilus sp. 3BR4]|uniref:AraC family transcriptional regulator n=1 Tax=Ammoniphilus sp. 3BR4 TaxID=3158265 RepID=UPI003466404E
MSRIEDKNHMRYPGPERGRVKEIIKFQKPPYLVYAGQISDNPEWKFPSHKHDDLSEIIFICEGEGTFIINNKTYTAEQGDILIYNKGVIHEEYSNPSNPLKTYFCGVSNLSIEGMKELHIIPSEIEPVIRKNKYSQKIESYMSDIFEESSLRAPGYEIICHNILTSLITTIIRIIKLDHMNNVAADSYSLAHRVKEFIDKNFTKNINLNDIAEKLHVNPYYLSHVFKKEMNYSPINYLINRRIGEAKRLLVSTDMKVWEIAKIVGYENANYFTLLFKKMTGESPKKFKENHTKKLIYHDK